MTRLFLVAKTLGALSLGAVLVSAENPAFCLSDTDCRASIRAGVHSLFCVEGECVQLKPPGTPCQSAVECASYPFFGPLACTGKGVNDVFSCLHVPSGAECTIGRPSAVSGCVGGFQCSNSNTGPVCTASVQKRWLMGPILSITGNVLINIGLNLQKKSYTDNHFSFYSVHCSLFILGVVVYALGKLSGFSSYIFGNQSLLASLGAVGLVANSIFAPMINKEVFGVCDLLSICFVLLGSSMIVANSGGGSRTFTWLELLQMYFVPSTLLWFLFLLGIIASLFIASVVVEENSEWKMNDEPRWVILEHQFTKNGYMLKYAMLFVYVGLSAAIASFTTLFAKSFGVMVSQILFGDLSLASVGPYLFFSLILFCTIAQIFWLNKALKRYDALLVIPVFHVLWTLTSVSTAGIYFKDFAYFTPAQFKGFLTGLVTIFIGSGFLTFRMVGKDAPTTEAIDLEVETKQK
ncbi:hypothetical protein NEDG_01817 [Nematocida displodere]|uniref:Uncharacterized protein n=1 Tax=Nematocida displodere TaxID=1805483 RepID=A0A177EK31_9MICR|nr:hypothetical protein NEDG_01817 [Nematocida displodere]